MDVKTILTIIATILTSAIPVLGAPYYFNVYLKRKFKKIQYLIDANSILSNIGDDFKSGFIEPTIQENLFFILSGIKTNNKSIPAYYELKDTLGQNYHWDIIRSAKPYFRFNNGGKIIIELSPSTIRMKKVSIGIAVICAIIAFIILFGSTYIDFKNPLVYLVLYIAVIMLCLLAFYILYVITPVQNASDLKKRLDQITNLEQQRATGLQHYPPHIGQI